MKFQTFQKPKYHSSSFMVKENLSRYAEKHNFHENAKDGAMRTTLLTKTGLPFLQTRVAAWRVLRAAAAIFECNPETRLGACAPKISVDQWRQIWLQVDFSRNEKNGALSGN
jgi:hypothetical protein